MSEVLPEASASTDAGLTEFLRQRHEARVPGSRKLTGWEVRFMLANQLRKELGSVRTTRVRPPRTKGVCIHCDNLVHTPDPRVGLIHINGFYACYRRPPLSTVHPYLVAEL